MGPLKLNKYINLYINKLNFFLFVKYLSHISLLLILRMNTYHININGNKNMYIDIFKKIKVDYQVTVIIIIIMTRLAFCTLKVAHVNQPPAIQHTSSGAPLLHMIVTR